MILQREVRQQDRRVERLEAPDAVAHDPVAQHYAERFGEFDWSAIPETPETNKQRGRLGHPRRAYLRSFLVMIEEKLETMPHLRHFLVTHPALVWVLEYRLVSAPERYWGFDIQASVPTAGHLGAMLRNLEPIWLTVLLRQSAQRVLATDEPARLSVTLDVTHQYAAVRQNNLRHEVLERFNPDCQPRGDPDCRFGFKPVTNQGNSPPSDAPSIHSQPGDYLWGYGSGIATALTSTQEAVVLAEQTRPFNVPDVDFAPALMDGILNVLHRLPDEFTADAAFDAQRIYAYFVNTSSRVVIPLNLRGKPRFVWTDQATPCCPHDGTPLQGRSAWFEDGLPRQSFRCPHCQRTHKLFIDPVHIYRWRCDRESPPARRIYRKRTVIERVNSLSEAYKLKHPHQRRRCAVAHRNTFIYIVLNLLVLQRLRQHHKDTLERPSYVAVA